MGQLESQRLCSHLLAIFLVQLLWLNSHSLAQQEYNTTTGYLCSDTGKKPCNAFALYRAQPAEGDIPSIANLFGVEESQIAALSGLAVNQTLSAGEPLLLPLTCGCHNGTSYAKVTYTILTGDTFYDLSTFNFESLSSATVVTDVNSNLNFLCLAAGQKIVFPVFCACPSAAQVSKGVTALVTYPVVPGDTVDHIASRFGVASADIITANDLEVDNPEIFYQQTLLIPFNTSQPTYNVTAPIVPGTNNHNAVNLGLILPLAIIGGVSVLVLLCVLIATIWKLWKQLHILREIQQALADQKVQPPFYSYNDLKVATRDFHRDNKLGEGAFGTVYKGLLPDKTQLAVKKLFNSARHSQVLNEFLNEVILITGIKHRNLIQLKGCCIKDNQRILVYECAENGNLAEALWGSKSHGMFIYLNWNQRWAICIEVARGLSYLHEELQPSIIHRDIKPANILLAKNFKPKIGDFGLARPFSDEQSQPLITQVAGTRGYFSPEYATLGQLTEKADVYSYGIVVLEVISGRKCIDNSLPIEKVFLRNWVHKMHEKGTLLDILQPELRKDCVTDEVIRAINIGLLCVQNDPQKRPTMAEVVTMFLGSMDVALFLDKSVGDHPDFTGLLADNRSEKQFTVEPLQLQRVTRGEANNFSLLGMPLDSEYSPSTRTGGGSMEHTSIIGR